MQNRAAAPLTSQAGRQVIPSVIGANDISRTYAHNVRHKLANLIARKDPR
ncbi:hypothetical protein GJV26_15015 [Massilia dura]|uniref:Uncharacterized protein n=1 Tax=Pseudoduganella dura TaxID=321982 RepID=A0A6I3XKN0_9BURK|nr:hypothetical protein [Pseudoduganella dura]MUI13762.1 hypothetical protein [Pseudoduganella dura]GGX75236.1 hypothetical protein GCM10007386_02740 [Pseudoduganella dura]